MQSEILELLAEIEEMEHRRDSIYKALTFVWSCPEGPLHGSQWEQTRIRQLDELCADIELTKGLLEDLQLAEAW